MFEQRSLDQLHERTGAAEIGIAGLEALHRGHDLLGLDDALRRIEVMDHLQPAGRAAIRASNSASKITDCLSRLA